MPTHTQPLFGNYYGYYTKRPVFDDDRLALLPSDLFQHRRVLDVGCNEGKVTCEIAQGRGAHLVVGVDIDDTLIQAAWKRRRAVWSTQEPSCASPESPGDPAHDRPLKKRKLDSGNDKGDVQSKLHPSRHYFPASCEHEFGPLPIPPSANRGKEAFPHNITFRTADWMRTDLPEDREGYNVVVAFSVSKWIHLNEGDEGLKQFFKRVYNVLKPGGSFVLEAQPWESYAKAKRMDQKLKENAKGLLIRPSDFENILRGIGFGPAQHCGSTGDGGFRRPVDVYAKS